MKAIKSKFLELLKIVFSPERFVPIREQYIMDDESSEEISTEEVEYLRRILADNLDLTKIFNNDPLILEYANYDYENEALEIFFNEMCPFLENTLGDEYVETNFLRMVHFLNEHYENTKNNFGSLLEIDLESDQRITILGDTHGQFLDLLEIFKRFGGPSEDHLYLFLGDYVDRGRHSFENILSLFYLQKICDYQNCFMLRGNHESVEMNLNYGFYDDIEDRFRTNQFFEIYEVLPIAAVINQGIFCCHGGVGIVEEENRSLDKIRMYRPTATRNDEKKEISHSEHEDIYYSLLWSDPSFIEGIKPNSRGGRTKVFGEDVTTDFLVKNDLNGVIRSHEFSPNGYSWDHSGKILTIFSCPDYAGVQKNYGAVATVFGSHNSIIPSPGEFEIDVIEESAYTS